MPGCAIALMVSLVSAKYLTNVGLDILHVPFLFCCAIICLVDYRNGGILDKETNPIEYSICFLYSLRIFVCALAGLGMIPVYAMWIVSAELFLVLQLILIGGGALGGGFNRFSDLYSDLHYRRIGNNQIAFEKQI